MPSFQKSRETLARGRQAEALLDAKPSLFFSNIQRIGGHPLFAERARGAHIWDVDGNRFIDFILGYGSVVLGHAHPKVNEAVIEQLLRTGANPTLLSDRQVELAEKLSSILPNVEAVTFLKTGSDATDAAVRLARAVTGRRYVLRWGMNGWHDWCAQSPKGTLDCASSFTKMLRYNDLVHAEKMIKQYREDLACVVIMPYEHEYPQDDFLRLLRNATKSSGALFILDEIRSGFRLSLGGAQEYFGVDADLVCYGKAIANGFAISALGGLKKYMRHVLDLGLTITYFRMPDAMAAACATIDELRSIDGPQRLEKLGTTLMLGFNKLATQHQLPCRAVGLPQSPLLKFDFGASNLNEKAMHIFCNEMLARGVLMSPMHHWFLCTSMSEDDVEYTLSAAKQSFRSLVKCM